MQRLFCFLQAACMHYGNVRNSSKRKRNKKKKKKIVQFQHIWHKFDRLKEQKAHYIKMEIKICTYIFENKIKKKNI